ncbi:MAG TPA: hypothetical protein VM536_16790 [Chloroflexia bacterium]|nr:hypothetical protein [Chloroflexia bacterium]
MMRKHNRPAEEQPAEEPKAAWEAMALTYVGDVNEIAMPGILKTGTTPDGGPTSFRDVGMGARRR